MPRWDRGHYDLELRQERSPQLVEGEDDPYAAADLALVRNIATYVNLHYPGHPWFIEASHYAGIVKINLPLLMKQNYFVVKISSLHTDPGFRSIIKGCGEILERYRLPRSGYSHSDFLAAQARHPIERMRQDTPVPV